MTGDHPDPDYRLDKAEIRRAFDRASGGYDKSAVLQTEVRNRLLDRLSLVSLEPSRVLDLGAGTGHAAAVLAKRYPKTRVCALDIAPGMLREARRNQSWFRKVDLVCADAADLPLDDDSVDLVFSNLMLQWCDDLDRVFSEVRRVLVPNGLFTFTTFGPDTLRELRGAFATVDDRVHVNHFVDMHDVGDGLVRARLAEPVMDVEYFTLTYDRVTDLMRDLKAIGAHNVSDGRPKGLTGRGRLAAVERAYEVHRSEGRLPATYEVVYGHAWAPDRDAGVSLTDGEARIPVDSIPRRRPR